MSLIIKFTEYDPWFIELKHVINTAQPKVHSGAIRITYNHDEKSGLYYLQMFYIFDGIAFVINLETKVLRDTLLGHIEEVKDLADQSGLNILKGELV